MSRENDWAVRITDIAITVNVPGIANPYVLQAEPYQPSDISSVSCPFVVLEDDGSETDIPIASGMQYRRSVVNLMLALERNEAGTDLKYNVQNARAWKDAMIAAFASHVRLSDPARTITASTNASPIRVTLAIPHRYLTGDQITIANHLVNTNANGAWNVTVIDDFSFTLNGSVGNGVGGQTGTSRKTQPFDMSNIVDAVIFRVRTVPYEYGSTQFIANKHIMLIREMYVTPISQ